MLKEIKISLPFYKIAYALSFIVILSLIRGVAYTYEIGVAMEPALAVLAAVFCADTYVQEIVSKRSEVHRLYPLKKRVCSLGERMMAQEIFLLLLAMIGYGLFFVFQKPKTFLMEQIGTGYELEQFLLYVGAMVITFGFWGVLSNTIACFFRNMWIGVGGCLMLWLFTNSLLGEKLFGSFNLFSYAQRDVTNSGDFRWICGKAVCLCFSLIMLALLPKIIKKRG